MTRSIAVDARMLGASGIGTYLDALLPRLVERLEARFFLLGDAALLSERAFTHHPRITIVPCSAPIYGPSEQPALALSIPREATTFWAPHVNAPLRFRGRLVVTVHDAYYLHPDARQAVRLDKWLYLRAMYARVARRADAIVCVSAFTADELVVRLGIARSRSVVIHNGVDSRWLTPIERPRPHPAPYALFVGNARPHKNLGRLLEAFASVPEPYELVVVGRLFDPPTAIPRVRFAGSVDDDTLRAFYAHAAALVVPSLYEGFGLPPLEAMASGVPALVARAASLPEICGDAALFCDPYDVADIARQLARVLHDAPLREHLVGRGRERVTRFSWDEAASALAGQL
jgi:glycosyltransferase involved in cell wall biosynthesis